MGLADVDASRVAEAESMLHDRIFPQVKAMSGFVSGTWTRTTDDKRGRSLILFETEADAKAALESARQMVPPQGAPLTFNPDNFEVVKVVGQI